LSPVILGKLLVLRGMAGHPAATAGNGSVLARAGVPARGQLGLLEQAPVPLLVTSLAGTVSACNEAAERLFGTTRDAVAGVSLRELAVGPETQKRVRDLLAAVARGRAWEGVLQVQARGGRRVVARFRCSALRNRAGSRIGAICVPLTVELGEATPSGAVAIGARIASARKQRGLTQEELAQRLGVTRRSVQTYESGRVVPYKRLPDIAAALEQPVSSFLPSEDSASSAGVGDAELRRVIREELADLFSVRDV
jgi:PAS domain S-box-containing protein